MLETRLHHPELQRLEAFGLGRLSDADSVEIELHLADCEECREKVANVPDDDLVQVLHRQAGDTRLGLSAQFADTAASLPHAPSLGQQQPGPGSFTVPSELQRHARYDVLESLGAGGMGTVYKARHRLMDRVVALKVVSPHLVNKPAAVERFTREVKAAARLVHPNIVTAYDADTVGDTLLLVMEYVEGRTLAQVLAAQSSPLAPREEAYDYDGASGKRQMPITHACEYVRQTALGLGHALARGMVHRDIKPQNLMLTPQGQIKILDFGLARFVSEQMLPDGSTEAGTLMGSPDYMAPEQAHDAHTADTRADIYGLGCTLYHLLSGHVPFPGKSILAKLEAHRDKSPLRLDQVRPDVPAELVRVVERMMAKAPARRYQTPAEVAEALRPFTEAGRIWAAPSASRTNRTALITLALGVLLLLGGLSYWAAPIVFRVETPQGTLIVTTDDPDVQISVKSGGKEVALFFPQQKKEIPLKIGEYTLELVKGKNGLTLSTNKFEIKSGKDQKTVKVEFEPAAVVKGAADRRAAEYVLSVGGKVRVNGLEQDITVSDDLPDGPLRLTHVVFANNKQVSDAGLANFQDCKYLTQLHLCGANVSDAGLAHFQDCKNLTNLTLIGTKVSNVGLAHFKDCKNLNFLYLEDTQVGDEGLAHFKERNLSVLALSRTQVTDQGLAYFKDCKNLYWLWLDDTQVGDAGLAHFQDCKELRYLMLRNTQVTDKGLAHLSGCTDLRQFLLEGTRISDDGLAHFQELQNVTQLSLANTQVSDAGLAHFKNCTGMKELYLANSQVGNESLAQIKNYKNLVELTLRKSKITAEGITELKEALPRCKIDDEPPRAEPKP